MPPPGIWARRTRALAALVLVCLPAWFPAAAPAAHAAPAVTLSADGPTKSVGRQARLVARTKRLPAGYRLVLEGRRGGHAKPLVFARCAAAVCSGLWGEGKAGSVRFDALVVKGSRVAARSRTVTVVWRDATPPPPTPPPPKPAPGPPAGHYCGLTDEGKSICFDVGGDSTISSLRTESIVTCGDGSSWVWTLSFAGPDPIVKPALTYSKTYTGPLPDNAGATGVVVTYSVDATFDLAGNATGQLLLSHIVWEAGGTHYDCAGEKRPWKARLGA